MATGLSETRETSPKPSLKQAGATHQPQHLFTETFGEENPLRGFPPFRRCEGVAVVSRLKEWEGKYDDRKQG